MKQQTFSRGGSCLLLSVALLSGCQYYARGPKDYKDVTRGVIETKNEQIHACYEETLKAKGDAAGKVVVSFEVAPKTGKFEDVKVLDESTAPKELSDCIVKALEGLAIDPADERQGNATFTWEFAKEG